VQLEKTLRDVLKIKSTDLINWRELVNAMLTGAASKIGEKQQKPLSIYRLDI
jgi:hypothetical protein